MRYTVAYTVGASIITVPLQTATWFDC